ncbi:uncharacterized protein Z519_11373 [Cladophialophora bantiana CBS 173.52]|uniref:Uncharacterized protein n=1 Tax=Cladophialophora bantiana (strain ATCC 10958 / CBS 173.52 / CDC B-1940 / NIH 8579) TaxID=1442370 RepID=A0A0D2FNH9_CLAB1|nr:uncharacterized protein Z519_11373 [Cladophialophora bantiana CBS 173.52]KIW88262.1 hypothetical protein Z519_11373 [Cladophialophora bantiana CBS 173.52]
MTKRRADHLRDISPRDPNHPWVARGYRPDVAYANRSAPIEDPYGEIAYQRAFAEAAESNSIRVPEPILYHNSPSARDYIRRRDELFFSIKPVKPNNKSGSQPATPTSANTSASSPGKPPSPKYSSESSFPHGRTDTNSKVEPGPPRPNASPSHKNVQQQSPRTIRPAAEQIPLVNGLPWTLEPKIHPSGPSRMLR